MPLVKSAFVSGMYGDTSFVKANMETFNRERKNAGLNISSTPRLGAPTRSESVKQVTTYLIELDLIIYNLIIILRTLGKRFINEIGESSRTIGTMVSKGMDIINKLLVTVRTSNFKSGGLANSTLATKQKLQGTINSLSRNINTLGTSIDRIFEELSSTLLRDARSKEPSNIMDMFSATNIENLYIEVKENIIPFIQAALNQSQSTYQASLSRFGGLKGRVGAKIESNLQGGGILMSPEPFYFNKDRYDPMKRFL